MHINAFLQAVKFYKANLPKSLIKFNGCIDYAFDDELVKRYASWHDQSAEDVFKFDESLKLYPGIFIKEAAYARPKEICKFLSSNFEILFNYEYESRAHLKNGKISVKFKNAKMQEIYEIVKEAQAAAIKVARAGVRACEIDLAARSVIAKAGYEKAFFHSTGHGVGVDIHELPVISARSETLIKEGMVFSVEPGIYLENEFGVRIEDVVVAREGGCEIL